MLIHTWECNLKNDVFSARAKDNSLKKKKEKSDQQKRHGSTNDWNMIVEKSLLLVINRSRVFRCLGGRRFPRIIDHKKIIPYLPCDSIFPANRSLEFVNIKTIYIYRWIRIKENKKILINHWLLNRAVNLFVYKHRLRRVKCKNWKG